MKFPKDFTFHQVCIQIKLIWVGIAIIGVLCGLERLNP